MKTCIVCGNKCNEESYPEIVFSIDNDTCVCEDCSIDFCEEDGEILRREDI